MRDIVDVELQQVPAQTTGKLGVGDLDAVRPSFPFHFMAASPSC
jgi:hypothetical protein